MCNYQGEIFAIKEAEFKISAATLLNLKKRNRKYFRSACCVTPLKLKIMHIIKYNNLDKRESGITEISYEIFGLPYEQDACYTGITRDAGADSFIPTVYFAD